MQMLTKRFGVVAGFALMLLLLALNTAILHRQLARQIERQYWVVHTREVMLELSETESQIKDAEISQRGFLFTNDSRYLDPFGTDRTSVAQHLDRLDRLTADNLIQHGRVQRLRDLSSRKMEELSETIALMRSGKAADARIFVESDRGLLLMNDIRALTAEMRAEEARLETIRSSSWRKSARMTFIGIYLASALAAIGLIILAYYILREMELRQRHAYQLLEREEWFRVTMTSLGDAVIATDERGVVTYLNPLAEQLIGRRVEEAKGRPVQDVFPIFNEDTLKPVDNPVAMVIELGRIVGLANHTVLQHSDGRLVPIEDSAAPIRDAESRLIGVVLVFRDATLQRRTQEALRDSEKLKAAARMSATVAHEINNPLEAVVNLIYLTKALPALPPAATEHLSLAEQELERVSHITKQTLGFYREARVAERIDMPNLVEYVLKLYSSKLYVKNIHVERDFGVCPPFTGVPGEIKQAVSNLISNAADAVGQDGTICVRLSCEEQHESKSIRVIVEDDGPGISPHHVEKIFEPFFSTKKDVGTGLGLWVTKEIIERHKGTIQIRAREESGLTGASFHVSLPVNEAPPREA